MRDQAVELVSNVGRLWSATDSACASAEVQHEPPAPAAIAPPQRFPGGRLAMSPSRRPHAVGTWEGILQEHSDQQAGPRHSGGPRRSWVGAGWGVLRWRVAGGGYDEGAVGGMGC